MELQRFTAKDMESARMAVIRDLGPDAVIINTSESNDGVELLAAVNFDPDLLPSFDSEPVPAAVTERGSNIMDNNLQQSLQRELELLTAYRQKRIALDERPDMVREEVQAELILLRKSLKSELDQLNRYRQQRKKADAAPDPDTVRLQTQLTELQHSLSAELQELSTYRQQRAEIDATLDPKTEALQSSLTGLQQCLADELLKLEEYRHKQSALDAELDPTRNRRWTDLAHLQDALASELSQLSEYRLQRREIDATSDPITANLQDCLTASHKVLQNELDDFRAYRAELNNQQVQLTQQHELLAKELAQFEALRSSQESFLASANPATLELQDSFRRLHDDVSEELAKLAEYHRQCRENDEARAPAVAMMHSELRETQALLVAEVKELQQYRQQRLAKDAEDDPRTAQMHADWDELQSLLRQELQSLIAYRDDRQAIDARTDPVNQGLQQELMNLQRGLRDELVQIGKQRQQRAEEQANVQPLVQELRELQQTLRQELADIREHQDEQKALERQTLAAELIQLKDYRKQPGSPNTKIRRLGLSNKINERIAAQLADSADGADDWPSILDAYGDLFSTGSDQILEQGGVIAIVGSTGVGKTTTVAKLAAQYVARHGKGTVALISTDTLRIGGATQLEAFANSLELPLASVSDAQELAGQLDAFSGYELVLIDTAGVSQRDVRFANQLRSLPQGVKPYVVLSATSGAEVTQEVIAAFQSVAIAGVIVSKVDEAASLGAVMSGVIHSELPVVYLCNGQNVPQDLRAATRQDLKRFTRVLVHRAEKLEAQQAAFVYGDG